MALPNSIPNGQPPQNPLAPVAPPVPPGPVAPPAQSNPEDLNALVSQMEAQAASRVAPPVTAPPAPVSRPGAGVGAIEAHADDARSFNLDEALRQMIVAGGSDLHVTVAIPPTMRLHGTMSPIPNTSILNGIAIREALYSILTSKQQALFEANSELDLAYTIPGVSRFRVNMFVQKGEMGAVFRAIPWEIKSLDSLGMPQVVNTFAGFERGFVLVTGPTGSGKSTTLAAILDEVNRTRSAHIMTVEDPIEFIHTHKKSIVNQREVGADTQSFQNALKHVLRQDPDIILVGELRDLETISVALTAAETGHLVFGTLHTQSAEETVSRITDVFPPEQQEQVRTQLAATLQAVLCQTLVKTRDGNGRVAAAEIMICDDGIRNQIRKGQLHQIQSTMETSAAKGMQTMVKHLSQLALAGTISYEAGWEKAPKRNEYETLTGGEAAVMRKIAESSGGYNDYRGSM